MKDINAAGGVLGEKLALEVGDDACDPKQAVAVANQMAAARVWSSWPDTSAPVHPSPLRKVYEEEGIVMISPASTNPKLTEERVRALTCSGSAVAMTSRAMWPAPS